MTTDEMISLSLGVLLCIFAIIAGISATKKKQYIHLVFIIIAFVLSLFLYAWITLAVSLVCIIWLKFKKDPNQDKQPLKSSKAVISGKVKCRFCKKLYSSEYNGCPYCKKV